jgi:hypothetical protein
VLSLHCAVEDTLQYEGICTCVRFHGEFFDPQSSSSTPLSVRSFSRGADVFARRHEQLSNQHLVSNASLLCLEPRRVCLRRAHRVLVCSFTERTLDLRMPASASRRLLVGLPFLLFLSTMLWVLAVRRPTTSAAQEQIEVFDRRSGDDGLDLSGLMGIDDVHRAGASHKGCWMYLVDGSGRLLLLNRGPHLKTCASSLTIVGEHNRPGEEDESAALRGLQEELGLTLASSDLHSIGALSFITTMLMGGRTASALTYGQQLWKLASA